MSQTENKEYWAGSELTFVCLADKKRTLAFKKAIESTVKKGDVVLEIGTGTGILSLFAIEAGAKKVYAVEADENLCGLLKKAFKSKNIELIIGDGRTVELLSKVDVIICEMISTGLIDELQLPVINNVLRFLKPRGSVIPSKMENIIELVYNDNVFYGYKLPVVRYEYPFGDAESIKDVGILRDSRVLSNTVVYSTIDFTRRNLNTVVSKEILFNITQHGIVNGIRLSNQTFFPNGATLGGTISYCIPMVLPTDEIKVSKGDKLILKLKYKLSGGLKSLDYKLDKK